MSAQNVHQSALSKAEESQGVSNKWIVRSAHQTRCVHRLTTLHDVTPAMHAVVEGIGGGDLSSTHNPAATRWGVAFSVRPSPKAARFNPKDICPQQVFRRDLLQGFRLYCS